MRVPKFLILSTGDEIDDAVRIARTIGEHWPERTVPRLATRQIGDFDPVEARACDVAIVISRHTHEVPILRPMLEVFEEHENAIVLLTDEPEARHLQTLIGSGAFVRPLDLDRPTLISLLHITSQRQQTIRRLRHELSIAQRFQGGLRGEINRMHDELQLAAMVQQEFLPRELPLVHNVMFGALWRPANYVSGDIYDISRLDEDHVGIFIADAVGHGVPAALMTMVIARSLPTKEVTGNSYRIVPPGEALARLNTEMIRRQGEVTRFATAIYAVLNCRSRELTIAGAGHPPPFHVSSDQILRPIETDGGLLGVFEEEHFEELQIELNVDDRLLFYSDGFEVAFPDDESPRTGDATRLPTKRYLDQFEALLAQHTPEEMVLEMARQLDNQPGSLHQIDDLTLICLQAGTLGSSSTTQTSRRSRPITSTI